MDAGYLVPPILARPGEICINPWSYQSLGVQLFTSGGGNGPISNNYISANLALFVPFWLPESVAITKLGWMNGAAVAGKSGGRLRCKAIVPASACASSESGGGPLSAGGMPGRISIV